MRAPVDDDATLQIYEDLFGILRDGGVPADRWPAAAAMLDAIVLGSALDESSPLPLWRPPGTDGYALIRSVTETAERPAKGSSSRCRQRSRPWPLWLRTPETPRRRSAAAFGLTLVQCLQE
ncbi:hypothetical protein [Nesterenkonia pannonica]|uniref:hypothetical protein n=1 Tax=Nesterenkonia pannonica TaxID=1548602 RepID=UPI0021649EEC|nr:hypothetical protein [Nesterenkonia pannonica]